MQATPSRVGWAGTAAALAVLDGRPGGVGCAKGDVVAQAPQVAAHVPVRSARWLSAGSCRSVILLSKLIQVLKISSACHVSCVLVRDVFKDLNGLWRVKPYPIAAGFAHWARRLGDLTDLG